ncbi:MAG: D-sedoheptulose 7-phosphate isomerase [Acidobacteria bacterium]|nr:D-sedoheptulose 7-phosphate isomerase [Acidobacteriota bacterium]
MTASEFAEVVSRTLTAAVRLHEQARTSSVDATVAATVAIVASLRSGGKILVCGNGGSASDAQHVAAELVGRFERERPALPAIALTTDTSILTAIGNDYGFDRVFARQVEAVGRAGDVLLGISTSGGSPNVLEAIGAAKSRGLTTVALTGRDGGVVGAAADIHINVPSPSTARVQEVHRTLLHAMCELVERELYA